MKKILLMIAATSVLAVSVKADETLWVYTQGTDTRPKGSWELKLANISRLDKDSGDYTFHDFRRKSNTALRTV